MSHTHTHTHTHTESVNKCIVLFCITMTEPTLVFLSILLNLVHFRNCGSVDDSLYPTVRKFIPKSSLSCSRCVYRNDLCWCGRGQLVRDYVIPRPISVLNGTHPIHEVRVTVPIDSRPNVTFPESVYPHRHRDTKTHGTWG